MDNSRQNAPSTATVGPQPAVEGSYYQPIGTGNALPPEPVTPIVPSMPIQPATPELSANMPKAETTAPTLAPLATPASFQGVSPLTQMSQAKPGDVSARMQSVNQSQPTQAKKWLWLGVGIIILLIIGVAIVYFSAQKPASQPIGDKMVTETEVQPAASDNTSVLAGQVCTTVGGNVFFYNVETETMDFVTLDPSQKEYSARLNPGTYKIFMETPGGAYLGYTDEDHNLDQVVLLADENSPGIDVCDEAVNTEAEPELFGQAKDVLPATVHGLVCTYGEDLFPEGSLIFYEADQKNMVTHKIPENENTFSVQVPAGEYAVFFAPNDTDLPKFGYTEYVTCGLDPNTCENHELLVNKLESGQEYGNIMVCDPQYVQANLPEELIYENE